VVGSVSRPPADSGNHSFTVVVESPITLGLTTLFVPSHRVEMFAPKYLTDPELALDGQQCDHTTSSLSVI
jgi:hypothetical protein